MADHDLDRVVAAQKGVHEQALAELRAGRKRSHWMWFIFPQLAGLGFSSMATRYALSNLDEARAYLDHPVLGPRLRACTEAAMSVDRSASEVFGAPDDLKFRSSMTLFECAAPADPLFGAALDRLCDGRRDQRTLELLAG